MGTLWTELTLTRMDGVSTCPFHLSISSLKVINPPQPPHGRKVGTCFSQPHEASTARRGITWPGAGVG